MSQMPYEFEVTSFTSNIPTTNLWYNNFRENLSGILQGERGKKEEMPG